MEKERPEIRHIDTSELFEVLFEDIRDELGRGKGFVPIIGAGVSAASGVPLVSEIRNYLAGCFLKLFGIEREDDADKRRWNPRSDKWPSLRGMSRLSFDDSARKLETHVRKLRDNKEPGLNIAQEAFGALSEWRSALLFLSRIRMNDACTEISKLGPSDSDVIDSFFVHITSGKRPSLPHHMLAALSEPLRFETLLTTNFEDLTEQAFGDVSQQLDIIDVHISAQFPSKMQLRDRRALVKLHGGRYGLRADYSLDQPPTDEEKALFSTYFRSSAEARSGDAFDPKVTPSSHALVLGISGAETRLVELLTSCLLRYNRNWREEKSPSQRNGSENANKDPSPFRIYWVCYTQSDEDKLIEQLDSLSSEYNRRNADKSNAKIVHKRLFPYKKDYEGNDDSSAWVPIHEAEVLIIRHEFLGLFLLQLFQAITATLPPKHALFPSASQLAIPPGYLTPPQQTALDYLLAQNPHKEVHRSIGDTARALLEINKEGPSQNRVLFICEKEKGAHGVASAGIFHYTRALRQGRQVIWIPLDSIGSSDALFELITDAVARKAGQTEWMPVVLYEQRWKATGEIHRLTEGRGDWVIFIDARDGAGDNVGAGRERVDGTNGWLDKKKELSDKEDRDELDEITANGESFLDTLLEIAGKQCPHVILVVLFNRYTKNKNRHDASENDEPASSTEFWKVLVSRGIFEEDANGICTQESPLALIPKEWAFIEAESEIDKQIAQLPHSNKTVVRSDVSPSADLVENSHLESPTENLQTNFTHKKAAKKALEWATHQGQDLQSESEKQEEIQRRMCFLLGLVATERVRYPALLLDDAFWQSVDDETLEPEASKDAHCHDTTARRKKVFGHCDAKHKWSHGWIGELSSPRYCLLRVGPGGFIWMHAETKRILRQYFRLNATLDFNNDQLNFALEKPPKFFDSKADFETEDKLESFRHHSSYWNIRVQILLARWYERLLASSSDFGAALESAHHYAQAAILALAAKETGLENAEMNPKEVRETSDNCLPKTFNAVVFECLAAVNRVLHQSEKLALVSGYPKTTCRRLVQFRRNDLQNIRKVLWPAQEQSVPIDSTLFASLASLDAAVKQCIHITRAIAREVSEHARAFFRHRQYLEYCATGDILDAVIYPDNATMVAGGGITKDKNKHINTTKRLEQWLRGKQESARKKIPIHPAISWGANLDKPHDVGLEAVRYRRQSAAIALATRAYPVAILSLSNSLDIAGAIAAADSEFRRFGLQGAWSTEAIKDNSQIQVIDKEDNMIHWPCRLVKEAEFLDTRGELRKEQKQSAHYPKPLEKLTKGQCCGLAEKSLLDEEILLEYDFLMSCLEESIRDSEMFYKNISRSLEEVRHVSQQNLLTEYLRVLSRIVQCCVCLAEANRFIRAADSDVVPRDKASAHDTDKHGSQCESVGEKQYCKVAILAWRSFKRGLSLFDGLQREDSEFFELRQQMEVQMSTVWAICKKWETANDAIEAAIESGQRTEPLQSELGGGVVELHRAQLFMLQARDITLFDQKGSSKAADDNDSPFHDGYLLRTVRAGIRNLVCSTLKNTRKGIADSLVPFPGQTSDKPQFGDPYTELTNSLGVRQLLAAKYYHGSQWLANQTEKARGLLDDAKTACRKAELGLIRKRKNVWWSTWLFEIQAKNVEYSLIVAIIDELNRLDDEYMSNTNKITELLQRDPGRDQWQYYQQWAKELLQCIEKSSIQHKATVNDKSNEQLQEIQKTLREVSNWLKGRKPTLTVTQKTNLRSCMIECACRSLESHWRKQFETRSRPAPVLGSETCVRRDETELDLALGRTLRMTRMDLVRLSRVVESYATSYSALAVLLTISPELERLPTRQQIMKKWLKETPPIAPRSANELLKSRIESRFRLEPMVDPMVARYAKNACEFATAVADITPILY